MFVNFSDCVCWFDIQIGNMKPFHFKDVAYGLNWVFVSKKKAFYFKSELVDLLFIWPNINETSKWVSYVEFYKM